MPGGRQKAKVKSRARAKPAETTPKPVVQPEPHKPVDYSKFENIQTSDDEDEQPHPGHHCEECAGAARARMPPPAQPMFECSEDEEDDSDADGEASDTDEDSYSSEDSEGWVPKKTPEQAGSSVGGTSAGRAQLAPAKPAAAKTPVTKAAASKFGLKSGFLTGGKANGGASSRAKGAHKTDAGNGIKEVSDDESDEDDIMGNGVTTGANVGSRAARGPTGVQPLPNGKYTRAELASFYDSDAPPSLHSSEEDVTRMHYSDMDFATAKPANRGTASGSYTSSRKAAEAASTEPAAGGSGDSRTAPAHRSSAAAARSAKTAGKTSSTAGPGAPETAAKYSPDQKRVAAAVMTMLKSARRTLHPAAESVLRFNFGLHQPDTKPLLAMIPTSGDLPSVVKLLELAGRPEDTDVVEAVMPIEPQSARKMPVMGESGHQRHDLVLSHQIRPDLAMLMSFMCRKVAQEKSQGQRKHIKFYSRLLPGISELFELKDTSAVPGSLVAQLNSALVAHRDEAAKQLPSSGSDPIKHLLHFLISAGDVEDDEDTSIFFDLLTETVPHLDEPTLFLKEEGAPAHSSIEAGVRAAARAAPQKPADSTTAGGPAGSVNGRGAPRAASPAAPHTPVPLGGFHGAVNWVKKLGADGDMREAAAMAMLKMIETRDLVDCTQKDSTSKEKPVSQKDMSAFIEDLVPGVHDVMLSCAWQAGLDPSLGGLDFVASHFHKVAQAYRRQIARSKRPHHELFDAKLARTPRLAEMRQVRRLVRAVEVASSPLVAGFCGRLQHPACLLKVELPPPSVAASELGDIGVPAVYAAIDKILSIFLESTDITQTGDRLEMLLPGMEAVMRFETEGPAGLESGWHFQCADHLLAVLTKTGAEKSTKGETLGQCIRRRAAEARLPCSKQLVEELLENLIMLPDALTPAALALKARKKSGTSKGLSRRQRELLGMEGSAYRVQWVSGEPIIVQDMESVMRLKLSHDEEQFITQHARDAKEAERQGRPAAAAPQGPKAQRSPRRPGGTKQASASTGGPRAKHASKMSRDDDSDSLPDLMDDEELTSTSAAPPVGRDARSPRDARSTTSTRAVRHASSASVEGVDTIFNVDSDSDGGNLWVSPDYPGYDTPDPGYPAEYWPEPRLPKGVPEAERTRLREKMMKRREEQDAKALQEKLAASQVQRQEAAKLEAERKAEEQRQKVAQKLIEEEEAAKKKVARQAEARQKKKAKKAKQRGLKQQKVPTKEAGSDSEEGGEEEVPGTPDSNGQESQEHDLAAFAGLRVSDSSVSIKGAAKVKADGKKASAKAQPKPAPGNAQKPEQPKQAEPPSKERVDADAVQRGVSEVMTAFGNVPRSLAHNAPQGSSSIAQQLQQHSKAPALPPASEMLRELEAAIDSRDVDRLETAIKKGDAWAKRAPINHFMSQVRQKLKQARELQRRQLPMGAAPIHQAPRAEVQQPCASAFPAAVQALFQRPPSPGHIPPHPPQQQRQPPLPAQAAPPRTVPAPIPPHLQTSRQAPHARPYQPPMPAPRPASPAAPPQAPSTVQRVIPPALHDARVAEMSQEWKAAMQAQRKAPAVGVPVAQQISEEHEDDELCVVCWDRPREVIFLGCGHMCACQGCAADIMDVEHRAFCPLCRAKITNTMMAKF